MTASQGLKSRALFARSRAGPRPEQCTRFSGMQVPVPGKFSLSLAVSDLFMLTKHQRVSLSHERRRCLFPRVPYLLVVWRCASVVCSSHQRHGLQGSLQYMHCRSTVVFLSGHAGRRISVEYPENGDPGGHVVDSSSYVASYFTHRWISSFQDRLSCDLQHRFITRVHLICI